MFPIHRLPLLLFLVVLAFAARAQEGTSIIKYAPLSGIGYERVLANNRAVYVGGSLYSVSTIGIRTTALGLKAEYRFYGLAKSSPKEAPDGLWLAPTVLFWNIRIRDYDFGFYDEVDNTVAFQLGGIAGYQWRFGAEKRISFEPAAGLAFTAVGNDSESFIGSTVLPLFALRVGYVLK